MTTPTLTEDLRERSPETPAESDALDAVLHELVGAARHACPTIALPLDVFIAYLAERIPSDVPQPLALRQMHTADLYLACACARGDEHALAAFEERCLRSLDRVLFKMGIDADASAEIKQDIRRRVLVGDGGPAQIVDFSGRGDLRSWVRVMAVRQALRRQHRARREVPLDDDELLQHRVVPGDPASEHLKAAYRLEFRRAFEEALQALPDRERTLLRQHYLDGLTIDELGDLCRMHRATAARLLGRARLALLEATRKRLMSRLDVPAEELDSIMRMIRSQIEVTLRGLLRKRRR